jgi:translation initiation factor 1 (eIF-1/SUI1)
VPFDPRDAASLAAAPAALAAAPSVQRDEVAKLWLQKMERFHSLAQRAGGGVDGGTGAGAGAGAGVIAEEVAVKRGDPPAVEVYVKKQARRATTHVLGAHRYGLDLAALAKALQKALAAAACVQPAAHNPTLTEVSVQGDEADRVRRFLVERAGLPQDFVVVVVR